MIMVVFALDSSDVFAIFSISNRSMVYVTLAIAITCFIGCGIWTTLKKRIRHNTEPTIPPDFPFSRAQDERDSTRSTTPLARVVSTSKKDSFVPSLGTITESPEDKTNQSSESAGDDEVFNNILNYKFEFPINVKKISSADSAVTTSWSSYPELAASAPFSPYHITWITPEVAMEQRPSVSDSNLLSKPTSASPGRLRRDPAVTLYEDKGVSNNQSCGSSANQSVYHPPNNTPTNDSESINSESALTNGILPDDMIINETYSMPQKNKQDSHSCTSTSSCSLVEPNSFQNNTNNTTSQARDLQPRDVQSRDVQPRDVQAREPSLISRSLLSRSTPALSTNHNEATMPVLMSDADMEASDIPVSNLTSQLLARAARDRYMTRRTTESSTAGYNDEAYTSQPEVHPRSAHSGLDGLSHSPSMNVLMGSAENSTSTIQHANQMSSHSNSSYIPLGQTGDSGNTSLSVQQDSGEFDRNVMTSAYTGQGNPQLPDRYRSRQDDAYRTRQDGAYSTRQDGAYRTRQDGAYYMPAPQHHTLQYSVGSNRSVMADYNQHPSVYVPAFIGNQSMNLSHGCFQTVASQPSLATSSESSLNVDSSLSSYLFPETFASDTEASDHVGSGSVSAMPSFTSAASVPGNEMLHLSGPIPIGHEYNTLNYGRESLESFQGPPVHYQGTDVTSHFSRQHHMPQVNTFTHQQYQHNYEMLPPDVHTEQMIQPAPPGYEDYMTSQGSSSSLNMSMTTQGTTTPEYKTRTGSSISGSTSTSGTTVLGPAAARIRELQQHYHNDQMQHHSRYQHNCGVSDWDGYQLGTPEARHHGKAAPGSHGVHHNHNLDNYLTGKPGFTPGHIRMTDNRRSDPTHDHRRHNVLSEFHQQTSGLYSRQSYPPVLHHRVYKC